MSEREQSRFQVAPRSGPLLIYDGDCSFCMRWIHRWRLITGSRVSYVPYQATASQFSQIPLERFEASL